MEHEFDAERPVSLTLGGRADPSPLRAERAEGRGGDAALRLEKRTHLDEARYRISLTNYGNGLAEVGWSFIPASLPKKSGKGLSEKREQNEDRAVRRAKSRLRRLILSVRADHLLTLTYRENVTDFAQACADLQKFVRLVKAGSPGWVYIAVAEQQKRGAWHWHLAVCGRQDVDFLRSSWRHVVGEGNIDVNPPKGAAKHRELALVRYLGKYLAKSFGDANRDLNGRRFRSSLGIEIPVEYVTLPPEHRDRITTYVLGRLFDAAGSIGHVWNPEDRLAGWACSWK